MRNVIFIVTIILSSWSQLAYSQDYKKIKKFLDKGHYQSVWEEANKALVSNQNDETLNYYAGVAGLKLYRQSDALDHLLKSSSDINSNYYFYLSKAYFENDQYEMAMKTSKNIDKKTLTDQQLYLIEKQYSAYELLSQEPGKVVVKNMGDKINSESHEYNGVMTQDQKSVVYTVRKKGVSSQANDGMAYEEIFKTTLDDENQWMQPEKFKGHTNKSSHDASVAIFDNDTKMITYHDEDLYISELEDGEWSEPLPLNQLNGDGSAETHCFVTNSFDTIYYATNLYSENGDLDLYMISRQGEDWSEPSPLESLNTPYNDDSPFLAANGDFYFSSQGHNSMGGYDIFKSTFNEISGKWESPVNMGYKINSPSDDIYFNTFGKIAYFSSGRKGGYGNMDIYRVFLFDKVQIAGQVIDEKTKKALAGAQISVKGDETTTVTSDEKGVYMIEVPIEKVFEMDISFENRVIYQEKHLAKVLFKNQNDNVMHLQVDLSGTEKNQLDEPKEIKVKMVNDYETNPAELVSEEEISNLLTLEVLNPVANSKSLALNNNYELPIVYFDFNESDLQISYRKELLNLAKFLHVNKDKNIQIIGHTDLPGSTNYNSNLGLERAYEIKEFLMQVGINENRVLVVSKGELSPVESTDIKSSKNRRAELEFFTAENQNNKNIAANQ